MYKSVYVADYVCGQQIHMHKLWTHTHTHTNRRFQKMFRLSVLPDRSWHLSLCWFSVSLMKQIQLWCIPLTQTHTYIHIYRLQQLLKSQLKSVFFFCLTPLIYNTENGKHSHLFMNFSCTTPKWQALLFTQMSYCVIRKKQFTVF